MIITITVAVALFGSVWGVCEPGWEEYNSTCYYFSRVAETLAGAQTICRDFLDANLVEVQDQQENDFLSRNAGKHTREYRLGLTDLVQEGHWVWGSSRSPLGFSTWSFLEPNGHGQENCVILGLNGHWFDTKCSDSRYFICEQRQIQYQVNIVG